MSECQRDGELVSVQAGLPRTCPCSRSGDTAKPWTTGFFKSRVDGPVWLGLLNLQGDGQADLVHHGGANKAVCAYSADHFPFWRRELSGVDIQGGAFGENFTISGLTERDVCIGDVWQVGEARLQVSQPRQPCWKLARRWNFNDLALRVQQSGCTGWYFRVLKEGFVAGGSPMELVERTYADWTIEKANHVMHHDKANLAEAARLAAVLLLSPNWREALFQRVRQEVQPNEAVRLNGSE